MASQSSTSSQRSIRRRGSLTCHCGEPQFWGAPRPKKIRVADFGVVSTITKERKKEGTKERKKEKRERARRVVMVVILFTHHFQLHNFRSRAPIDAPFVPTRSLFHPLRFYTTCKHAQCMISEAYELAIPVTIDGECASRACT
ncbi:hypothetical protein PIB30_088920 [Stylosanthes scabra]|uniref:Uncharacterized protein n=1 Tax=Stylosanthes scabra TaxID=79078 RepID=A0ABU6TUJ3_9FABA|nr:hypothetical protein [Stylosanthes scabra]